MVGVGVTKDGDGLSESDVTVIAEDGMPIGAKHDVVKPFAEPVGTSIRRLLGGGEGVDERIACDTFVLDRLSVTGLCCREPRRVDGRPGVVKLAMGSENGDRE